MPPTPAGAARLSQFRMSKLSDNLGDELDGLIERVSMNPQEKVMSPWVLDAHGEKVAWRTTPALASRTTMSGSCPGCHDQSFLSSLALIQDVNKHMAWGHPVQCCACQRVLLERGDTGGIPPLQLYWSSDHGIATAPCGGHEE